MVTFGGCHSEYVHLNELHLFDFKKFFEFGPSNPVTCTEINVAEGVPSTRWGHASATYKGELYILGGRNEADIIDIHKFNFKSLKWTEI